jgi:hypothetical protein
MGPARCLQAVLNHCGFVLSECGLRQGLILTECGQENGLLSGTAVYVIGSLQVVASPSEGDERVENPRRDRALGRCPSLAERLTPMGKTERSYRRVSARGGDGRSASGSIAGQLERFDERTGPSAQLCRGHSAGRRSCGPGVHMRWAIASSLACSSRLKSSSRRTRGQREVVCCG